MLGRGALKFTLGQHLLHMVANTQRQVATAEMILCSSCAHPVVIAWSSFTTHSYEGMQPAFHVVQRQTLEAKELQSRWQLCRLQRVS
jgi:hypothetical protein